MLKTFRLLNRLKKDSLLWAIFDSASCKIETTKSPEVVAYVKPSKKGFEIVLSEALLDNKTWDFQFFVLCHEIMHVYFSHFNIEQQDKALDNVAKDFAINNFLADYLQYPIGQNDFEGVNAKFIKDNFGLDLKSDLDSYSVYQLLEKSKKKNDVNENGKNFCKTDASDLKISVKNKEVFSENLENSGLTSEDLKELTTAEDKLIHSPKTQGQGLSQSIARPILEKREGKPSIEVAKILLRKAVNNTAARITQKRSSRRDETIPGRIKEKQNKVCFVIDTSGSIGQDDLKIISEIIDYSSKSFEVTLRCGDTDLQNQTVLKKGQKVKIDFFKGGGGTDLNFAKQENDKFLHYLVFTDGYIPKFKEKFNRTLFIFGNGQTVENEKCFKLK